MQTRFIFSTRTTALVSAITAAVLASNIALADGIISGKLTSAQGSAALNGITIQLEELNREALTGDGGRFRVGMNPPAGIDGASETDGLEVTSLNLGARYPEGLLVVQDGRNVMPAEHQNFKLVDWRDISGLLLP